MPNGNNHRNLLGSDFSAPSKFYFYSLPKRKANFIFYNFSNRPEKFDIFSEI